MKPKGLLDRVKVFVSLFVFTSSIFPIQILSQEQGLDYNKHYQFPISLGVEYQTLSPFATYGSNFNIYEISAIARYPIPSLPVLQPTLKLGIISFDSQDSDDPDTWDHTHYFGALGILYSTRFSKNFEIGAEALSGFSHAVFPKLIPEEGPLGSSNVFFELGAHICLNPSYNFCIDIHPNIKYLFSLSSMKDFDGLIFGIGFSGHYRFGEDPDAPGAIIRCIRFDNVNIQPLFAAMQSYYTKNPFGNIRITNTDKNEITDIEITFFQAGYMDSPTPSGSFPDLKAGESIDIDLLASFNEEVFKTEGITPLTGEIIVKYKSNGKPAEQRQPVSYDLHDKTALMWNDDRKVAAFITTADSALRNYSSFIRQSCKADIVPDYNENLQIAIQVYHALGELGCIYQVDPTSPFTKVQENPMVVDSISLPRDTLKRITGDCDDLTVLYCSLLETVGIETGFITVPGHIYAVFNTDASTRLYRKVHPERAMTINVDGKLWVPVEITMIGKEDFLTAWRKGIEEWIANENNPEYRGFYIIRKSQELYRPVGLKETDLGLQYGNKVNIVKNFKQDIGELTDLIVKDYIISAEESAKKEDYNRLGITYAKFMQYQKAEDAFRMALKIDPDFLHAQVNLGNLMYLREDYSR
ncbi:MAG: tetratricopeptide repeat protein, partial [Spirochaetota bacterium]